MNSNQRRAENLARSLASGQLPPSDLADVDWALLLLAAEVRGTVATAAAVADRVLERAALRQGYFTPATARLRALD